MTHPMSIGETAANGVNHTPSGTESGEENISEVLANAKSSDTREGFIASERAAEIRACFHKLSHGVGLGYALCDDCGALLPDEDPDLRSKAEGVTP